MGLLDAVQLVPLLGRTVAALALFVVVRFFVKLVQVRRRVRRLASQHGIVSFSTHSPWENRTDENRHFYRTRFSLVIFPSWPSW